MIEKRDVALGVVLSIITCGIYGMIWAYGMGAKVNVVRSRYGAVPTDNSVVFLLLAIFGLQIVNSALIQSEINKCMDSGFIK